MEKIAIISDIHANKTALEAVFKDIEERNISRIFCLGDLVFKGVNPDFVIDEVKKRCEVVLKGNCDEAIASKNAIERKFWTRRKIGEERAEYLNKLPVMYEFYLSGHLIRIFHASPYGLHQVYNPIFSNKDTKYANHEIKDYKKLFQNTEFIGKTEYDAVPDIIGYAHIHTPSLYRFGNKTIFNTGSVGASNEMLNNGDINDMTNKFSTLSSYTILEGVFGTKELAPISITNVRVPYDISKEIEYIKKEDIYNKDEIIFTLKTASTIRK